VRISDSGKIHLPVFLVERALILLSPEKRAIFLTEAGHSNLTSIFGCIFERALAGKEIATDSTL